MSGKITSLPIAILLGGMSLAGTDSVSKAAAYTVIGDVNRPGIYGLAEPTRVFDAVAHAGGFRDPKPADNKEIVVIRGEEN